MVSTNLAYTVEESTGKKSDRDNFRLEYLHSLTSRIREINPITYDATNDSRLYASVIPHTQKDQDKLKKALEVPYFDTSKKSLRKKQTLLQQWEGHVTAIGETSFVAELVDLTNHDSAPSEVVEISLEELSDSDRRELVVGTLFRWIIGYRYDGSTKSRISQIVVRRLPAWTARDIYSSKIRAENLSNSINWEAQD